MRLDAPHLRSIESGVCADFDLLAGRILAGDKPMVVQGFAISATLNASADTATVIVADSALLHNQASASGTILYIPEGTAAESLSVTNAKVSGSFSPGINNYIGLDLVRVAESSTADLVMFYNPDSNSDVPRTIPLGRMFEYRFVISNETFDTQPTILPLAIIETNSDNTIRTVTDARQMAFRLGSGGTIPNNQAIYSWSNRTESDFSGADKDISSFREWMEAMMTRTWELGGGEFWYSPTADRNVNLVWHGSPFTGTNENFSWDGENLLWQGLRFVFDNSTATYNDIADQTSPSAGLTDLVDGDCVYVDVDRSQNLTGTSALAVHKTTLDAVGIASNRPGSRYVFAWNQGGKVFTRNWRYALGQTFLPASTSRLGVVKTNVTPGDVNNPIAVALDMNNTTSIGVTSTATGTALTLVGTGIGLDATGSGEAGVIARAGGPNSVGLVVIGDGADDGNFAPDSQGIVTFAVGIGLEAFSSGSIGVQGTGATNGVKGISSGTSGTGVEGIGGGSGSGVFGSGGTTSGIGVYGSGGAPNGIGVKGQGTGTGVGVHGFGGSTNGGGVYGTGTGAGIGVYGQGGASGIGVQGQGGGTAEGVSGLGGITNGHGVAGTGGGTGSGIYGQGGSGGGPGGEFNPGTGSKNAIVSNGYIDLSGSPVPATIDVIPPKTITPISAPVAWGIFSLDYDGSQVNLLSGMNMGTPADSVTATSVTVGINTPLSSANCAVIAIANTKVGSPYNTPVLCVPIVQSTSGVYSVKIDFYSIDGTDISNTQTPWSGLTLSVVVFGS